VIALEWWAIFARSLLRTCLGAPALSMAHGAVNSYVFYFMIWHWGCRRCAGCHRCSSGGTTTGNGHRQTQTLGIC